MLIVRVSSILTALWGTSCPVSVGDRLVAIDGNSTASMTSTQVRRMGVVAVVVAMGWGGVGWGGVGWGGVGWGGVGWGGVGWGGVGFDASLCRAGVLRSVWCGLRLGVTVGVCSWESPAQVSLLLSSVLDATTPRLLEFAVDKFVDRNLKRAGSAGAVPEAERVRRQLAQATVYDARYGTSGSGSPTHRRVILQLNCRPIGVVFNVSSAVS
jgi:hypothetical protein